ncbi:MAG: T9SS type A sorting domain-containing protein [bacterium]|nr:T9SS type A sorting domain-containing protein [bacterium]
MKKILVGLMLIVPLSIFADEMIVNGGFDSGTAGWTGGANPGRSATCYTKSHSSPASWEVCAYARKPSYTWGNASLYQTIQTAVSCVCEFWYQYTGTQTMWNGLFVSFVINGKDSTMWTRGITSGLGENLTWTHWSWCLTDKDTLTRILFHSTANSPSSVSTDSVVFWIDDVSITGTPVVGIEEPLISDFACLSGRQGFRNAELKIIKEKIYLSVPNDYSTLERSGNLDLSAVGGLKAELTIYDLCGREKEVVYNGTLTKGNYTFTPNIKKSGIYFVRLTAVCHSDPDLSGEESNIITETKKMILIK